MGIAVPRKLCHSISHTQGRVSWTHIPAAHSSFLPGETNLHPIKATFIVTLNSSICAKLCSSKLRPLVFLQGLVFTVLAQGVNALQTFGFFTVSDSQEIYQDIVNKEGLGRLNAYASEAGRSGCPAMEALNRHYGPGEDRAARDVEAIWLVSVEHDCCDKCRACCYHMFLLCVSQMYPACCLHPNHLPLALQVRRAVSELGGVRAVNCKSGKDRTALELSISFVQEAVAAGILLPSSPPSFVTDALQRGLSYDM